MFLVVGALLVISNNQLALSDSQNVESFLDSYVLWLDNIFFNIKDLSSKVFELNWEPQ